MTAPVEHLQNPPEHDTLDVTKLPIYWRREAMRLQRWGVRAEATVLERVADQLENALREEQRDALTLSEAAEFTGYSAEHIGRLVRQGKLENVGRKHAPRVRRGDLTHKLGREPLPTTPAPLTLQSSRETIARDIATAKE